MRKGLEQTTVEDVRFYNSYRCIHRDISTIEDRNSYYEDGILDYLSFPRIFLFRHRGQDSTEDGIR